jgi:hypothetical protein
MMIKPEDVEDSAEVAAAVKRFEAIVDSDLKEKDGISMGPVTDEGPDRLVLNAILRHYENAGYDTRVEFQGQRP